MKIKGFLAILVLAVVVVYFLWIVKAGKEGVVEEVKAFSKAKQEATKTNMASLAREIYSYIAQAGRSPKSLKEFRTLHPLRGTVLDAWGTVIKYERLSDDDFRLISAGQDGTFNTSDDIVQDY